MKVNEWLTNATRQLDDAGVITARLDCLILLEDAMGKDRSYLLAHPEVEINGQIQAHLNLQVDRRENHEPLAYIRGKSEFYGREFLVNEHTLEPRPETETMIQLLKELMRKERNEMKETTVADIGTGSGCIGITVKLEIPDTQVVATDISKECIKIAEQNAQKLGADVKFFQGDLLQPLQSSEFNLQSSILLANLPYVPDSHTINQAAMQEPKIAIFGGSDGLNLYRRMFEQTKKLQPQFIFTESLPFQHAALAKIAKKAGYHLEKTDDFIQVFYL